ncbi:hypothetical protein SY83_14000 [Paenibacillus swuensis]|uniref:TIGR04086 family membrane protein n=1 Tax=Paenibacillus swuensis TaxID=1178515 RepID=A0A172TJW0_9BACL|nr:TIGR04086 family membrane protein [Paenibacillus swuensis]ANE47194.1 hypothetical protein SY83_14000 [Paenibacillus swuensis]
MNPIHTMSTKVNQVRMTSPLLSGLVTSLAWLTAGTLILSLFVTFGGMKEESLPMYTYIVHGLSLLFGGISAGKQAGHKGWYYGGLTGLLYGIFIFIVGFLGFDAGLSLNTLLMTVGSFLMGALGGMFGVNLRK